MCNTWIWAMMCVYSSVCLSGLAVSLYCNDCHVVYSSSNEADDDDIDNMLMIRMVMMTMTIVMIMAIITTTITMMEVSLSLLIMMTGQMFAVLLDVQDWRQSVRISRGKQDVAGATPGDHKAAHDWWPQSCQGMVMGKCVHTCVYVCVFVHSHAFVCVHMQVHMQEHVCHLDPSFQNVN